MFTERLYSNGNTNCNVWQGTYDQGWGNNLVPDAYQHPAKVSFKLAERIYTHALENRWIEKGSIVLDPFGGICGFGFHAMAMGLTFIAMELEKKFVDLGWQNINKWYADLRGWPNLGTARMVQGDSRQLKAVLEGADIVVSSPPYSDIDKGYGHRPNRWGKVKDNPNFKGRTHWEDDSNRPSDYGHTPGNLANMKEGDVDLICSSPPFTEQTKFCTYNETKGFHSYDKNESKNRMKRDYIDGSSPGQLGSMKEGSIDLCVSSPPYSEIASGAGGLNTKLPKHSGQQSGRNPKSSSQDTDKHYGKSEGQLSGMPEGSFDLIASSPPYEGTRFDGGPLDEKNEWRKNIRKSVGGQPRGGYAENTQGQVANSDTFWSASREIVQGCHDILKPGGHAIWVTKNYVKNKRIVPFSDRWQTLCESVGFTLVCRHQTMLVKEHGTQMTSYGDEKITTERKSFFRRLAESKGSPRIDFENVICMMKKGG